MSEDTKNKFDKVRAMCESLNLTKEQTSDEYLFTLDATDLVFYKRNMGAIDISEGFTDGKDDGGIDFIYTDDDTMYLIQGKSTTSLSIEKIKNIFDKMADTVSDFDDKRAYNKYSDKLISIYQNAYDSLGTNKNIELVLFTNAKVNDRTRNELSKFAKSDRMNDYELTIYDCDDLEVEDALIYQQSDLIKEDSIEMFLDDSPDSTSNNILHYGKYGIIVNIKASDLKRLYLQYKKKGLFSYNLREHISNPTVDNGIDNTINKDKDNFWYYNNGITIGCENFDKDGNRIRLRGFSVINGAQTTTKIGESKLIDDEYDFAIVCKIIEAEKSVSQDSDFINKISEASNSQKPIRPRDLKANANEQKILQRNCAKNGKYCLAVEIKRGVRPRNYNKVESWQRVTNEYLGQLIYACILQHPGPARSEKNSLFTNNKIYRQVFLRKHDCDTLYDLVRIANVYDEYKSEYANTDDMDKIAILKNGKLTILACLIYLVKKEKHIVTNASSDDIYKDNISGLLVTDYDGDDLDQKLDDLFDFIITKLQYVYDTNRIDMKITSYANFFKSEQFYSLMLKRLDSVNNFEQKMLADLMLVFTKKKKY